MKKFGALTLALALLALTAAPALARSVSVAVDGKVYTFCGDELPARVEADGMTFLIGEGEVVVRRPGEPDLHLPLASEASADAVAEDGTAGETAAGECEVSVVLADAAAEERGVVAETVSTAVEDVCITREWGAADAAEYAAFAPYGLRCDAEAGRLYYMGERVRVFEDARPVDGGIAELSCFDAAGVVDVRALRGSDGALTGLEKLSEAEFAARDLSAWTNPAPVSGEATATDEHEPTPGEMMSFFAPYAPFGLRYDAERDRLYINGRPVRNFLDVRASNGESLAGGNFHGSLTQLRFDGEVDVTTIRDYAQPDENGEGKLIGLEVAEAERP